MIFATDSFIALYIFIVLYCFDYFMKTILALEYSQENITIANYIISKPSLIWKNGSGNEGRVM